MDLVNRFHARKRRQGGMAYVETLLALPTVMILLFGLADFSFAFQDYLAANHAAEVGARTASLSQGNSCATGTVEQRAQDAVAEAMVRAGVIDAAGQALYANSVTVDRVDAGGNLCVAGLLQVTVPVVTDLPLLQSFLNILPGLGSALEDLDYDVIAVAQNENI